MSQECNYEMLQVISLIDMTYWTLICSFSVRDKLFLLKGKAVGPLVKGGRSTEEMY